MKLFFFTEPISAELNTPIEVAVVGISPINVTDCRRVFGDLTRANGSLCYCPTDISFENDDGITRCCK